MATISKMAGVLLVLVLLSALIWWRDQAMADTYRLNRIKQLQQQRRALAADVLRSRADCIEYGVEGVEAKLRLQCMEGVAEEARSAAATARKLEEAEDRLRARISAPPQEKD